MLDKDKTQNIINEKKRVKILEQKWNHEKLLYVGINEPLLTTQTASVNYDQIFFCILKSFVEYLSNTVASVFTVFFLLLYCNIKI